MYVLANRDMELRCDEAVIRRFGADSRSAYALALLSMEEKRSGPEPFASAFSKNAIEERIIAIMKMKKRSIAVILAAAALVCCVGVGFATSAKDKAPYPTVQDGTLYGWELFRRHVRLQQFFHHAFFCVAMHPLIVGRPALPLRALRPDLGIQ
mgnify:CR=1 FL=1